MILIKKKNKSLASTFNKMLSTNTTCNVIEINKTFYSTLPLKHNINIKQIKY